MGIEEAQIRTENGITMAVPAFPAPCSYVRLLGEGGEELAYWDHQEWRDEPEEVMGAIMGAICEGPDGLKATLSRPRTAID